MKLEIKVIEVGRNKTAACVDMEGTLKELCMMTVTAVTGVMGAIEAEGSDEEANLLRELLLRTLEKPGCWKSTVSMQPVNAECDDAPGYIHVGTQK